jgi:hypothetical protein
VAWKGRNQHWRRRATKNLATGLRHGFRSGLEVRNGEHLKANKVKVLFETRKIKYTVPETLRTYTVDFELPNGILVETKGRFEPTDRAKHVLIKLQHPELDIRFVFQNPRAPIYKGSPTSYADWAEKHGFKWAKGLIPVEWMRESSEKGEGLE